MRRARAPALEAAGDAAPKESAACFEFGVPGVLDEDRALVVDAVTLTPLAADRRRVDDDPVGCIAAHQPRTSGANGIESSIGPSKFALLAAGLCLGSSAGFADKLRNFPFAPSRIQP